MINLAEVLPPTSIAPDTFIGELRISYGLPLTITQHRILATRDLARSVLDLLPSGAIVLDCSDVEVMSPSFIHELRTARADLTFTDMNEDAQASLDLVEEQLSGSA